MSAVRATFDRTLGRARGLFVTAFAFGGFLAVSGLLFMQGLERAEGGPLSLAVVWAASVAPALPALAALLGMGVWSDERQSRRLDLLLSVGVAERDLVLGKFLGVFAQLSLAVSLSLACAVASLHVMAPLALVGVSVPDVCLAVLALLVQGALWASVSVAASAIFMPSAAAACATVLLLVVAPRGIWTGLLSWSKKGSAFFGEMPLDAHVVDIASGMLPIGTVALYAMLTALSLFVASKAVAACRLVGRGARALRLTTALSVALALTLSVLAGFLFSELNPVLDLTSAQSGREVSMRTQNILSETSGTVTITVFLPRRDPLFRPVSRLLRALQRKSGSIGGARIELRFVDPRWDLGAADRLVRRGIKEDSLVFETARRFATVSVHDGVGERICASAIRRVSAPPRRHKIYWTTGHGESRFDDYGAFGMSDIARDLFREGFSHEALDLSAGQVVPSDGAMILVAGARDDFSRAEIARLNAYLKEGGRLMVLLASSKAGGVVSLLPAWGIKPYERPFRGTGTSSGTDVIATEFAEHPISAPLKGARLVFERPLAFSPSAVAASGTGADRFGFTPVAQIDAAAVVAAVERGDGLGDDLAIRPTRIVALGDASFVINGQLAVRANANRDFFLNCVSYLTGQEAHGTGEDDVESFRSGTDRRDRRHLAMALCVCVPSGAFAILLLVVVGRRRRK